eukprot:1659893-Rhodomonas_salina.1
MHISRRRAPRMTATMRDGKGMGIWRAQGEALGFMLAVGRPGYPGTRRRNSYPGNHTRPPRVPPWAAAGFRGQFNI